MFQRTLLFLLALFLAIPVSHAATANGVDIPDTLASADGELVLNGSGLRKKMFLKLYVGSLYLKNPSTDANVVITADEPMAIRLDITSKLITAEKMEKATREGFEKATAGDTSSISEEIDQFIGVFRSGVAEGDSFVMRYQPGSGTAISKNGADSGTVAGLKFKQALFGIWLSNNPVQKNLKASMLGN